jgi:hypothetical protein
MVLFASFAYFAVEKQFSVVSSRFPVCPPLSVFCPPFSVHHPLRSAYRLCNSRKGKTPRERKTSYSFGRKELRDSGALSAHGIPSPFVQHGARVEGRSGPRRSLAIDY